MIYDNAALSIGRTPLIRLNKITRELGATVLVKTESRNPAGSIKDRIAYAMIEDAEKAGTLKSGMTIIEPTSGNTGIALCYIAKAKRYDIEIVMPENMSLERRQIMTGFGADLILTPASAGMRGAIERTDTLVKDNPGKYFTPGQFINPANPAIHVLTTAPEIDLETEGKVDAIVAGAGTGGTISGIGYYFKNFNSSNVKIVAVEPAKSPVITQTLKQEPIKPSPHGIQGIGAGFIPQTLNLSVIDEVVAIDDEEAIEYAKRLMREEGILSGISGGAALAGAIRLIKAGDYKGKTVVVILPDSGERYLSTALYN
ncbi:MAG: cysteine synthase A [Deferribacteraceae bacterium]|jgi:cysteine synthase A|nr:cysteine synthase A [Deferribacteraceae bacterium]